MIKVIGKSIVAIILGLLIYAVLDVGVYQKIIHYKEQPWLIAFHRKYLYVPYFDKYGHFIMGGLIAFFLNILMDWKKISIEKILILQGSLIVGIGFTIMEMYHYFTPKRNFELLDLFFTYAGIFVIGGLKNWLTKARQLLSRTHKT